MKYISGDKFHNIPNVAHIKGHKLERYLYSGNPMPDIIVSHESDACVVKEKMKNVDCVFNREQIPENVKRIYAQNCEVKDDLLQPVPIGLENKHWIGNKWELIQKYKGRSKPTMCYMNHNVKTNKNRKRPYEILEDKNWVKTTHGKHNYKVEEYFADLASAIFMICPDGNGTDCHRTWEALYLDTIPIVERHPWSECFEKLFPMVIIDNWEQVTYHFLEKEMVEQREKAGYEKYLNMEFWEGLIQSGAKL